MRHHRHKPLQSEKVFVIVIFEIVGSSPEKLKNYFLVLSSVRRSARAGGIERISAARRRFPPSQCVRLNITETVTIQELEVWLPW